MNLYEFSQQNNREMGILIERENEADKPVYDDAWRDIESILNNATDFSYVEAPKKNEKPESIKLEDARPEITTTSKQNNHSGKYLSATALSKELGVSSKELNHKFEKLNWIEKKNDEWVLTSLGKSKGAQMKSGQYGDYIAYPESIIKEVS